MTLFRNKRYHQNYNHNTLFPGAVFTTKHNGECSVLGRSEDKSRRGYYVVQFKDSGIIKEAYGTHIKSGAVSGDAFPSSEDERITLLMKPRYYDVGYIGNGKHSTIENTRSHQRTRAFILWHNMLARCYMTVKGKQYLAICILGLEFIYSNLRFLVGQKAASGWIFLFFTTLRKSNIGWILSRALSRVNPTLHLLPASTMSECAVHTRPCLVLLEYHCRPCGLLWSTTSLHG